jgi:hypothetical protein
LRNSRGTLGEGRRGGEPVRSGRSGIDSVNVYDGPAGGWGLARRVASILTQERVPLSGPAALLRQNRPEGFMCVSCTWAKPAKTHPLEFCENGAKAKAWEITSRHADRAFFAATV